MNSLKWWMRIVGAVYVLNCIAMTVIKAPIESLGPPNTLDLAASGDRLAMFLADTWIGFGIEVGVIGVALLLASRVPERGKVLAWTVIGIELMKGPVWDSYMIVRGYDSTTMIVWIAIHSVIMLTGIFAIRSARTVKA